MRTANCKSFFIIVTRRACRAHLWFFVWFVHEKLFQTENLNLLCKHRFSNKGIKILKSALCNTSSCPQTSQLSGLPQPPATPTVPATGNGTPLRGYRPEAPHMKRKKYVWVWMSTRFVMHIFHASWCLWRSPSITASARPFWCSYRMRNAFFA